MTGKSTSLATQTERIAAMGKRENGRGISILAKKEPKSTRESGIVMEPMNEAIGNVSWLRFDSDAMCEVDEPVSMRNARGGLPSGPFHKGPPSELTSTKSALSGCMRAMHNEPAITRLMGANTSDKVWRSLRSRGFIGVGAGSTVDSRSDWGEVVTWMEGGFSPFSMLSGRSVALDGSEAAVGCRGGFLSRYL